MKKSMKTYVLILSQVFPSSHPRTGKPTEFCIKMKNALAVQRGDAPQWNKELKEKYPTALKIHTIRANYEYWHNAFEQIEAGQACLSVRRWSGKPRRSRQTEIARLTSEDGIGLQKLEIDKDRDVILGLNNSGKHTDIETVANNDGLSLQDWKDWFRGYDLNRPMAIIHFTKFRY